MGLIDKLLPVEAPDPCTAPAAFPTPYTQAATDAWVARCDGCRRTVKYDVEQDAAREAAHHNATGQWSVDPV